MRNDGKWFEDFVQSEVLNKHRAKDFIYRRLYDSYTAQGRPMPAQPADFDCCLGRSFYLECKTSNHLKGRFSKNSFSQLPTMRKWAMVGRPGVLLINFYKIPAMYVVNVMDMDPSLKSWLIPEIGIGVSNDTIMKTINRFLL